MNRSRRRRFRRDLTVGAIASLLTAVVLVPLGWAAVRGQLEQAKEEAQRNLVGEALRALTDLQGGERTDAEALRATTDAVAPEIRQGAHVLIDRKASAYEVGDIIVYRAGENSYLGRVAAVDRPASRLVIRRNGEPAHAVDERDVVGRAVLNTR